MTGYDPYSYGQIKLSDKPDRAAETPDDILFEDAGPMPQACLGEDNSSDWELPQTDTDVLMGSMTGELSDADFGDEILGECGPGAPAPSPRTMPQSMPVATHEEPDEAEVARQRRRNNRATL
ncbi:MAG: hypothetical protein KDC98_22030, partial [Planctomycetes bacterium]|nr:hypothetical protein [Planctomycetota bacterium]